MERKVHSALCGRLKIKQEQVKTAGESRYLNYGSQQKRFSGQTLHGEGLK